MFVFFFKILLVLDMLEPSFFFTALSNEAINIYNIWQEFSRQVPNLWKSPKSGAHPTSFTGIALVTVCQLQCIV